MFSLFIISLCSYSFSLSFQKLEDESELKEEHIQCSNLGQLEALADVASEVADVCRRSMIKYCVQYMYSSDEN